MFKVKNKNTTSPPPPPPPPPPPRTYFTPFPSVSIVEIE